MRYISHMCVMELVTYDLDIKLTCIIRYKVFSYISIDADILFTTFRLIFKMIFNVYLFNIWYAFNTKYMLGLRHLIYKLYYLFCYMS